MQPKITNPQKTVGNNNINDNNQTLKIKENVAEVRMQNLPNLANKQKKNQQTNKSNTYQYLKLIANFINAYARCSGFTMKLCIQNNLFFLCFLFQLSN